jgi:hypothetical protein
LPQFRLIGSSASTIERTLIVYSAYVTQVATYNLRGYKPLLVMQSPPSRTSLLVREGGLCNISHDFNRRRSINSNLGYVLNIFQQIESIYRPKMKMSCFGRRSISAKVIYLALQYSVSSLPKASSLTEAAFISVIWALNTGIFLVLIAGAI